MFVGVICVTCCLFFEFIWDFVEDSFCELFDCVLFFGVPWLGIKGEVFRLGSKKPLRDALNAYVMFQNKLQSKPSQTPLWHTLYGVSTLAHFVRGFQRSLIGEQM